MDYSNYSDQFPKGLRVLAIDDDSISLTTLVSMLKECHYHVTTTSEASTALNMVKENKNEFDIVICNVHMPDMDESKLPELAELKPLIIMSAKFDMELLKKGYRHGACEYMPKPVTLEQLKNIWQHVLKREACDSRDKQTSNTLDKNSAEGKRQKENVSENNPSARKKSRLFWSKELHQKFVEATDELGGLDKAIPKKIQGLMNVEGLTRDSVAAHLQKYRIYMKRANNSTLARKGADIVTASSSQNSSLIDALNLRKFSAYGMDYRKGQYENNIQNADPFALMKSRVYWSVELHQKFLEVINQQGLEFFDKVVHPEEIPKLMNIKSFNTESFYYHLQKYRLFMKTKGGNQQELLANMILGYQLVKEFNVPDRSVFPGEAHGGLNTPTALPTGMMGNDIGNGNGNGNGNGSGST